MMSWRKRQKQYHDTNNVDDYDKEYVLIDDPISTLLYAREYFKTDIPVLIYPAKSYAVAYIYAYLIKHLFQVEETIQDLLSDPLLLYGNDPFFRPYSEETRYIYDHLIECVTLDDILRTSQAQQTVQYFLKEMLLWDV